MWTPNVSISGISEWPRNWIDTTVAIKSSPQMMAELEIVVVVVVIVVVVQNKIDFSNGTESVTVTKFFIYLSVTQQRVEGFTHNGAAKESYLSLWFVA